MPSHRIRVRIGIDVMGSDNSPELLLQTTSDLANTLQKNIELIPIGAPQYASLTPLSYQIAPSTIEMEDRPLTAIRKKRDSSLCIGLRMLQKKEIDAFVSAGNTGALVTYAKMALGMLPGVLRPALLALMPTRRLPVAVLDVGANTENKAAHLVQFALIGAAYKKARGVELPSVGLLNIGQEATKGTLQLRLAYAELLRMSKLSSPFFRFAGNIEGLGVFDGQIDVLITDGFTGNVFLKTAEGIASLILDRLNEKLSFEFREHLQDHLLDLKHHLHYAEYPGALLSGVRGIVIKCHGYSSAQAFVNAIREAVRIASEGFLQVLENKLFMNYL